MLFSTIYMYIYIQYIHLNGFPIWAMLAFPEPGPLDPPCIHQQGVPLNQLQALTLRNISVCSQGYCRNICFLLVYTHIQYTKIYIYIYI